MEGVLLPVIFENLATRSDGSVKLVFGTLELTPHTGAQLLGIRGKACIIYLSDKEPPQDELDKVDKLDSEFGGKSQSQRIRNVLYKLFEQNAEGYKTFDEYYKGKTELYIEHLKSKIQ